MAHDAAPQVDPGAKLVIRSRTTAIGRACEIDAEGATTVIDAHGCGVAPGPVDNQFHPGESCSVPPSPGQAQS